MRAFEQLGCHIEVIDSGWDDPIEMEHLYYTANFAGNVGPFLEQWEDRMDPGLVACAPRPARH